ncbi:MAG: hypothetical protein JO279_05975 [Verrucomicrobia bacterium]|nr:hypothetical protein [Verrucomicrobiota bacterium]
MKTSDQLRTIQISLSLVTLALGFSALGFSSLMNIQAGQATSIFSAEHAYSLIGSVFSFLVGSTFLVAALTFKGVKTESERLIGRMDANLLS